jgi:hypothetical protein
MAQEDKGLVLRGMILLLVILAIVGVVLTILLRRAPEDKSISERPAEFFVPSVVLPTVGAFPSSVNWGAMCEMMTTMPSAPGFDIRYDAAKTLARRGSPNTPWALFREMLDERQQLRNNRVRHADGREVYDEANARAIMTSAVRAVAAWHKKQGDKTPNVPAELREVYAAVDKLAESPFGELKIQADKARATFFR